MLIFNEQKVNPILNQWEDPWQHDLETEVYKFHGLFYYRIYLNHKNGIWRKEYHSHDHIHKYGKGFEIKVKAEKAARDFINKHNGE